MTYITVVEYDPQWVRDFEMIRDFVTPSLSDIVLAVEHIGSTSVPGLPAKPIVDIDVVVATRNDVQIAIEKLATLGYVHEGDLGIKGREAFIPPDKMPWHHLYVCTIDNAEFRRHIKFRDYLRNHPQVAKDYGELKLKLVKEFHNDHKAYTNGKTDFVEEILKQAGEKNKI
ncbi:GrpB family protein [Gracilibacillus saliphilus]|uniref:GrpB family protein n=1 Tax=Gracilibacillus saliphilus TaxID=543890 RepID=UPI0013D286CB|nr:GrpB family protein [Gracilibacillus saliphilus]